MNNRKGGLLLQFCLACLLLLASMMLAPEAPLAKKAGTLAGEAAPPAAQATPALATTTVTDTIYRADGTAASGTVLISWTAFTNASGAVIPAGSTSVTLGAGGANGADGTLTVELVANAGATPAGSYYTVLYHLDDGSLTREYWAVPVSTSPVHLAAVRTTVLPASVAMQTASKSYVDTAIAAAALGHPLDASTPYVLKSGDSMTGPLVLPGDPVTSLQASDKSYVDAQVMGLQAGLGQKVSTLPQATQTVAQPAGTQLQVNNLNGQLFAGQYVTGAGTANANSNGIANAAASPDCLHGCDLVADHSYASTEQPAPTTWNNGTLAEDRRNGQKVDTYQNPLSPNGNDIGQVVNLTSTESAPATLARTGSQQILSAGLQINNSALTGGSNEFPRQLQGAYPYFKTTYSALGLNSTGNTLGQHIQLTQSQHCYGVGDCLIGSLFLFGAGGFRDDADEGTHPYDYTVGEEPAIYQGICAGGCSTGSTSLQITSTAGPGTQGEGRYLIDTNPAKVLSTGTLTGGLRTGRQPAATFAGTSFPVSTFLETLETIPTQATSVSPGTVTVAIAGAGLPAGFATSTAALPAPTGVACVADTEAGAGGLLRFETAPYTVIDFSHLQLTLQRPHQAGATIAVGGLCGYGLEQTVDTLNGVRQVFPVIGATDAATLLYAGGGLTSIVGQQGFTSAFTNISLAIASATRTGNVVTLTTAGAFGADVNGLTLTVQGVADPSYNGQFVVTTTAQNALTYTDNGPDSTSAGGTITYVTGGYKLYPMAEVVSVYNSATKAVDGGMTLAANTAAWAAGDPVEQPHYFQQRVYADVETVDQTMPRPTESRTAGVQYTTSAGPGLTGFSISNKAAASSYFGNGGTHTAPDTAFETDGVWQRALDLQAGEQAMARIHCNSHGCNRWNSGYDLFQLDTGVGRDQINFAPQNSQLLFELRGTGYLFTPQAFTAGTINVATLNAGSVHGLFQGAVAASSLPVFAPSGSKHAIGAVPDPGATAGSTRFLREDGTWAPTGAGTLVQSAGGYSTTGPGNLPQRARLLGEYLMSEGSGATVHDTSGSGNDATITNATWDGTQDLDFQVGAYVSVPAALNAAKSWMFLAYFPIEGTQTAPQAPGYLHPTGYPSILCGTTTGQVCLISSLYNQSRSYTFEAFNTDSTAAGEPMPPGWHVFTLSCGVAGVPARLFYDGAEVGSYKQQGSNTCPTAAAGNYQIGGSGLYAGTLFAGKMAGVWAWNQPLSAADATAAAQSALAYLAGKGVSRTFRKVLQPAPQILAGLDSRTAGYLLTPQTAWPALMSLTDATYLRTNLAVSGEEALDVCNEFDLAYASQAGEGSGPVITVLWGGVNDMQKSTQSARQIANNLKCLVQKAKSIGRVVLATEISATGNSPGGGTVETLKSQLDLILRAEAFGWGADNLVDLATDPVLGGDGASTSTAYFFDGLHPNAVGQQRVAALMSNAVNELLGASETQRHQTADAAYQELAGDRFLDLTSSSSQITQTVTLPDCTGYSLPRQMLNLGAAAASVATLNGQALAGSASIAPGSRGVFLPVPGVPSTGGCRWERTQ